MNINQPSLVLFEDKFSIERDKENFYFPIGSNLFFDIGNGQIYIKYINEDEDLFDLFIYIGTVKTGDKIFNINNKPYRTMSIYPDTHLEVNNQLKINGATLEVHGTLELLPGSKLEVINGGKVIFHPDSKFIIHNESDIAVGNDSSITIYGSINVHLSRVESILDVSGIIIDSAAVMEVDGIPPQNRPYSMTNYDSDLRDMRINVHTQGETNYEDGRIGYTWMGGSPNESSQILKMILLWGEAILGDFKFSVLGMPNESIPNLQIISDLLIKKNTKLYITENYKGSRYIKPDLYLGLIIGNNKSPAVCIVEGEIIVDGLNASITIDRGARLYIRPGAKVHLKNQAVIRCTHNGSDPVLFIDGELIIDDIAQISMFQKENIVFGENGKLIVLNPDTGTKRILWSTPLGIEETNLYRLFKDRIDHVEYHIQNNTGISIDKYFEFYARDFTKWYGDRRIEKAIYDGIIVWHNGGFIEISNDIIPWVDNKCNLLHASRLFKSFASYDEERLQEVADRLKYAGCGNILFRFIKDRKIKEVILTLDGIEMTNVISNATKETYILDTTNDGTLFMKNKLSDVTVNNIVNPESKTIEVIGNNVEFTL